MLETIWSAAEEKSIEVEFTDAEHTALTDFVQARVTDGEWFLPQQIDELMPAKWRDNDTFDTTAIVQQFLPEGFGCEMHGWEDFCITKLED